MRSLSTFCCDCGGTGEEVSGDRRSDTYTVHPCWSCGGDGGFGPAFHGDAVPVDQAALDRINAATRAVRAVQ